MSVVAGRWARRRVVAAMVAALTASGVVVLAAPAGASSGATIRIETTRFAVPGAPTIGYTYDLKQPSAFTHFDATEAAALFSGGEFSGVRVPLWASEPQAGTKNFRPYGDTSALVASAYDTFGPGFDAADYASEVEKIQLAQSASPVPVSVFLSLKLYNPGASGTFSPWMKPPASDWITSYAAVVTHALAYLAVHHVQVNYLGLLNEIPIVAGKPYTLFDQTNDANVDPVPGAGAQADRDAYATEYESLVAQVQSDIAVANQEIAANPSEGSADDISTTISLVGPDNYGPDTTTGFVADDDLLAGLTDLGDPSAVTVAGTHFFTDEADSQTAAYAQFRASAGSRRIWDTEYHWQEPDSPWDATEGSPTASREAIDAMLGLFTNVKNDTTNITFWSYGDGRFPAGSTDCEDDVQCALETRFVADTNHTALLAQPTDQFTPIDQMGTEMYGNLNEQAFTVTHGLLRGLTFVFVVNDREWAVNGEHIVATKRGTAIPTSAGRMTQWAGDDLAPTTTTLTRHGTGTGSYLIANLPAHSITEIVFGHS